MKRHPAVHHNENKRCHVSFRYKGSIVIKRDQRFSSRQAAVTHFKAYYRGASQFSVVFYVPQTETLAQPLQGEAYENET